MGALKGNQNSVGNSGGKKLNDRKLAAQVRTLTLKKIKEILENSIDDIDLYKAVLLKLAGTVLPRLQEHTGEDGAGIVFTTINYKKITKRKVVVPYAKNNNPL